MKKLKFLKMLSGLGLTATTVPVAATACSTGGPKRPDFEYPEDDLDPDMGVDSIPGPVQPEEDIDTDMQVPAFGPVQPDEDIDTDMQVPAFGPVQPDFDIDPEMGVDSIPGPVQPEEDIDTDMNVDVNNAQIIDITYSDLASLRSVNNLIPGQSYRIIDYVTTASESEWSISANNRFDIIITALTNNTFSEDAKAIQNQNDSYFANSNLAAWNIKYCFDNNTNRFSWATSDGKGVIYYMKDEFGNEAPYDFKNLKFKPYYDATRSKTKYDQNIFVYTFASGYTSDNKDMSLLATNHVYWNSLGNKESYNLPRIVMFGSENYNNVFENGCSKITFGATLNILNDGITYYRGYNFGNSFGQYCEKMTFEWANQSNSFGQKNHDNFFGASSYYNTFGAYNWGNVFGDEARFNSFGNNNYENKFGNKFWSNSVKNDCRYNTFGNGCYYNDLGNNCYNNRIGNNCLGNFFSINCVNVTLKDGTNNTKINV